MLRVRAILDGDGRWEILGNWSVCAAPQGPEAHLLPETLSAKGTEGKNKPRIVTGERRMRTVERGGLWLVGGEEFVSNVAASV